MSEGYQEPVSPGVLYQSTDQKEKGGLLINPGKPLRDDGLWGIGMIVKKAGSGWEASLPGALLWGLLPGKRGESRYRVFGRDAPEWVPGDPGS